MSSLTLQIGYMMCGWTQKKQCPHDKMAGCLVVDLNYDPQNPPHPTKTPLWVFAAAGAVALLFALYMEAFFSGSLIQALRTKAATFP